MYFEPEYRRVTNGLLSHFVDLAVLRLPAPEGFGMGAFFSLMSSTFAYEDPTSRTWQNATMNTTQKTAVIFKDMGKGMWRGGKGFGTVGALYAGSECVIEGVSLHQSTFQSNTVPDVDLHSTQILHF